MFSKKKSRPGLRRGRVLLCAAAVCLGWSLSAHAKATYTTFDPPNSEGTTPNSIVNGVITGYYWIGTPAHGFVRAADGTITTFDPDGATNTYPYGLSSTGAIAGYFTDSSNLEHGFVRSVDGTITSFDASGANYTEAYGINKSGEIAGIYYNSPGQVNSHGFERNAKGKITTYDPSGSTDTFGVAINDKGVIAGYYFDASQVQHGFVRTADGTITPFDPPGSISTTAVTINRRGQVAGDYEDANGFHGYVRSDDGTFVTFELQQTCDYFGVVGIDEGGKVTGFCENGANIYHGFEWRPDGKLKVFDPPGSFFTLGLSISSGVIAGQYEDAEGLHGFLRTP